MSKLSSISVAILVMVVDKRENAGLFRDLGVT
jgi:hypothetical protein